MATRGPNSATAARPDRETLAGSVERVTFHNAENGFAMLRVNARGRRDLVTVVGHAALVSADEFIHALGAWLTDLVHGQQFRADVLKTTPPTTAEGKTRYLGSGMLRGIGPKLAARIVAHFGPGTFEIIEADPAKLREASGIGEWRAGRIAAVWAEKKAVRDIMLFLHGNGVSTSRAVRIFKAYGHDAIAVMTDDPYRLARDIRGIGFRSADAIAMRLGLSASDYLFPSRVRARPHMTTRQYGRLVDNWVDSIGLDSRRYGTHSMRRSKTSQIYKKTGNIRAVQILLGHTKLGSTVRYLGVEVDDALKSPSKLSFDQGGAASFSAAPPSRGLGYPLNELTTT